jgi:hypothetical protein
MSNELIIQRSSTQLARQQEQLEDALELHQELDKYRPGWREALASVAAERAIDTTELPEDIARTAARIALGLEPLQEQGEQ